MRIQFNGHDFDLNDGEALSMAATQRAEDLVNSVLEDSADPRQTAIDSLAMLLAGVVRYWLASGATLAMARAMNVQGISLGQALDQHNFIGALIGESPLDLLLEPEVTDQDAVDDLDVPERRLVDQKGRPIPPGQQDLPIEAT